VVKRLLVAIVIAAASCFLAGESAFAQTDDGIRELIKKAGDSKDYPGAPFVAVFEKTDVTVEESGLAHYRRHMLTKILTEKGALDRAVLRFDYDPASNYVRVESIRVFRKGGAIETIAPSAVKDFYAPAYMIYWGARMLLAELPRLEVGDAVEVRSYKKGFEIAYLGAEGEGGACGERDGSQHADVPVEAGVPDGVRSQAASPSDGSAPSASPQSKSIEDETRYVPPMRGHFYDVVIFQEHYPIREKRYDLHVPKYKPIQFKVYNGALFSAQAFDSTSTSYSWWRFDIPALKSEPRMADVSDISTKLVIATLPSWQEKSRWFAAIHDTIYLDNKAIKDKVKELTAGCTTDVEKVTALQHWAAQEIRYSGISMGKGEGYTHHPGKMTIRDRCGVCKDKAGMLVTLMKSAGYEVYPALTMAGARVEEVPADQFNHSVVAWRHKDGSYTMLDPTWVPYSTELWSSAEQEQNYVIGTPWGEGLMQTPYSAPENHVLLIVSKAALDKDGNLTGTMKITATEYMDQRLRRALGTHRRDDLRAYIEGWLAALSPSVELVRCSVGDALDFKRPFSLEVDYRVPSYAVASAGSLDFASPAWTIGLGNPSLFAAGAVIEAEKREYPRFIY
jgi:Domain of Unknown Function with PDB structure (DUF3857)/Transglutaminase-like superfamily